jgi:polysaccharide deacetylase family protein (PEP-CTERM system associated)
MYNALSIDVEDYFQVHALEGVVHRADWDSYPSRVEANTRRVLRVLADSHVRATFFVLGWVAERFPHLVVEIAAAGHEVATHGYWHELIYRQTPQEFAADLSRSLQALRSALATGGDTTAAVPVLGYRAPSFSIVRDSLWALDVLRDYGLCYDSSIFPLVAHDRYGIANANRFAHRLANGLWELPVSTVHLAGRNWPVAGGGYFRLYPYWLTCKGIRRINAEGHPAVVYLHPWEFDPHQPRISGVGAVSRFRHYVNLAQTEARFRRLLQDFPFAPMAEVFHLA